MVFLYVSEVMKHINQFPYKFAYDLVIFLDYRSTCLHHKKADFIILKVHTLLCMVWVPTQLSMLLILQGGGRLEAWLPKCATYNIRAVVTMKLTQNLRANVALSLCKLKLGEGAYSNESQD